MSQVRNSYILVESHLANFDQGKFLVRPDFGDVKQAPAVRLSLLGLHDLNIELPDREVATGYGTPQILVMEIGVHSGHASRLFVREVRDVINRAEVKLAVVESAISSDHLEGMHTKSSDATNGVRNATGTEKMHQSMDTFGLVDVEVPELTTLLAVIQMALID